MSKGSSRKIFILDDHPLLRRGYAYLIEREDDLELCGEAGNATEALEMLVDLKPDLIITDISLGDGTNGIEFIKTLQGFYPDLPVLVVSMHDEELYAGRALRAGARGYLIKRSKAEGIVPAIRQVLQGEIYLSEPFTRKLLFLYRSGSDGEIGATPVEQLTDRELEVFEHFGRGLSTREIGEALHISPKTVETYRSRIKTKLSIDSTTALLKRAVVWVQERGT